MQDVKVCEKIMKAKGQLYKALIESLSLEQINELIDGVEIVSKSPFSNSFYSSKDISWNHKPDGSYRISDHWNFWSRNSWHCQTTTDVPADSWSLGRYNAELGKYEIVKTFKAQYGRLEGLRAERRERKQVTCNYRQNRIQNIYAGILEERRKAAREQKIKNANRNYGAAIWVEVNVNKWSGTGRRVRFAGTETLLGMLAAESKTGNSFTLKFENGQQREIRKYNSYKELKRKPRARKTA